MTAYGASPAQPRHPEPAFWAKDLGSSREAVKGVNYGGSSPIKRAQNDGASNGQSQCPRKAADLRSRSLPWLLPAARTFRHPDEPPSFPAERSFGVRAACCRFPPRKLACGSFLPASSLAGISTPASVCIRIPSLQARVPASKLAGEKAAAICTHSKASLRLPSQAAGCGGFGNNQQSAMTVKERVARACSVGPRFVPQ